MFFSFYENKVLQLMSAGASLERFGKRYFVFIKWRSCKHCFKKEWTLELHPKPTNIAIMIKGVHENNLFCLWLNSIRPTKFPSKNFISKAKFILILYFLRFKLQKMCRIGAPVAFKTWCGHQYMVGIGLRGLPKLGVDTSPRPHAHRCAWI